jgi:hypothetical protein
MPHTEPINYTEDYEKLHAEFVKSVIDYHNLYVIFTKGRNSKTKGLAVRHALKRVRDLSAEMIRESLRIRDRQKEDNKDKYIQNTLRGGDASRFYKHDVDTSGDSS